MKNMFSQQLRRRGKHLIFPLVFITIIALFNYTFKPIATKKLKTLDTELKQINTIDGITLTNYYTEKKPTVVMVEAKYSINIDSEKAFQFFENELKRKGWTFSRTIKNENSEEKLFKKEDFKARISYINSKEVYFLIDLSWRFKWENITDIFSRGKG